MQRECRRASETDRDCMEKGTRAFVSYIRGYKEHHCKFIFRFQDLPLGPLATSFGLLRMPKVSETSNKRGKKQAIVNDFVPSEVDPETVKYADKTREKQRQLNLKRKAQEASTEGKDGNQQGKNKAQQHAPKKQKVQHVANNEKEKQQQVHEGKMSKTQRMRHKDEDADMLEEYRMLRKVRTHLSQL